MNFLAVDWWPVYWLKQWAMPCNSGINMIDSSLSAQMLAILFFLTILFKDLITYSKMHIS